MTYERQMDYASIEYRDDCHVPVRVTSNLEGSYVMKIGIVGGRAFHDERLIQSAVNEVMSPFEDNCDMVVFLGGASKGAERLAMDHIVGDLQMDYVLFLPYNMVDTRTPHHPKYFYYRNKQIVDNSDVLIIFDDEEEGNLAKTIDYICNATHKDYHIYYQDGTSTHRNTFSTPPVAAVG